MNFGVGCVFVQLWYVDVEYDDVWFDFEEFGQSVCVVVGFEYLEVCVGQSFVCYEVDEFVVVGDEYVFEGE